MVAGLELSAEKVWGLSGFHWNIPISIAAWVMGLAQIPFIIISSGACGTERKWTTTRGKRPPWNGPRPLRRRMATSRRAGRLSRALRIQPAGPEKDYTMQTEPVQPNERARREPTMSLSH
jgi:hypothetical protein